jgi:small basic protein
MPLKETPKSLRLYFGVVAAVSFYYGVAMVAQGPLSPLVAVFSALNILFGALFSYIVVKFSALLHTNPSFIKWILAANLTFSVVGFGLSLLEGIQFGSVVVLVLAVLIYVYLVRSVTRLSNEARLKTAF